MFIPNAGRALYGLVKDFRPISLTSFILNLLETLVDSYINEVALVASPLHPGQRAYYEAKSKETALVEVMTELEKRILWAGAREGEMAPYFGAATMDTIWSCGLVATLQIKKLQEDVEQFPEIGPRRHGGLHENYPTRCE